MPESALTDHLRLLQVQFQQAAATYPGLRHVYAEAFMHRPEPEQRLDWDEGLGSEVEAEEFASNIRATVPGFGWPRPRCSTCTWGIRLPEWEPWQWLFDGTTTPWRHSRSWLFNDHAIHQTHLKRAGLGGIKIIQPDREFTKRAKHFETLMRSAGQLLLRFPTPLAVPSDLRAWLGPVLPERTSILPADVHGGSARWDTWLHWLGWSGLSPAFRIDRTTWSHQKGSVVYRYRDPSDLAWARLETDERWRLPPSFPDPPEWFASEIEDVFQASVWAIAAILGQWDGVRDATTAAPGPAVILGSSYRDDAWVRGKPKTGLTTAQFDVVKALLKAGRHGLTGDLLVNKSGHTDAVNILGRVQDLDADWRAVILFPGKGGRFYRIAWTDDPQAHP